jgi:hypothetical protein
MRKSLNAHQLNQYQQSEQSPLILTKLAEHKKNTAYDVRNPGPYVGQVHTLGGIKPVNGILTLLITGSPTTLHI